MPYNQIKCETYCNRAFGCSFYKKGNNYDKYIGNGLKSILIEYKSDREGGNDSSLFDILSRQYKPRYFAKIAYKEDRKRIESVFIDCIKNLDQFFSKYEVSDISGTYLYRGRIRGQIGARAIIKGKEYNVDFSYSDTKETFYNLFYHSFNSYLYNVCNNTENDLLVYMPRTDTYYSIKNKNYTIKYGFLQGTIQRKTYRPGHQCLTCSVRGCTPRLITNIERI